MQLKLILCSQSPRRKELLSHLEIPFVIRVPDIDEDAVVGDAMFVSKTLALQKAKKIFDQESGQNICLGADTVVVLDGKQYAKPKDKDFAKQMLRELENAWHEVITGVAIVGVDNSGKFKERSFAVKTRVRFGKMTEDLLDRYVASGEPLDKAGSYGIQGKALSFIEEIEGSYSNVVGFPLAEIYQSLISFLNAEGDEVGNWRNLFS